MTQKEVYSKVKQEIKDLQEKEIIAHDSIEHGFNSSIRDGLMGVDLTPEQRHNMGKSMRGKHHTDATKNKISASSIGRKVTDETRAKISLGNRGKKRTELQNLAQSKRLKGKEPKAASEGAKKWHKANPGGWWSSHEITQETREKIKSIQRAKHPNILAMSKDGTYSKVFQSMPEIESELGVKPGSVHNNIKAGADHYTKSGYRFEYITNII